MAFVAPLAAAALAGGGAAAAGGTLATALTVGSSVLGGVSGLQQGYYQAAVAKNNARVAEANAARESEASQEEARRSDVEYAAMLGEQMALQGASGFDILGRSQVATRNLTRSVAADAREDIRDAGTARARASLQDAANFRTEARSAKRQGWVSLAGGLLSAGSSLATSRRPKKVP